MNGKLVWGLTGFVAVAIVGGAIFLAKNKKETSASVVSVAQEVSLPQESPEPEEKTMQDSTQAAPPVQEVASPAPVADPDAVIPELQIGELAGTLKASIPGYVGSLESKERFPLEYTCYRSNLSPPVVWSGVPADGKSLVAIFEKQGEEGKTIWSWAAYDIDPGAGSLAAGAANQKERAFRQGLNDHGNGNYTGPCEPKRIIPYTLTFYALDKKLDLPDEVSRATLISAMNGHIIDRAVIQIYHFLEM